MGARPLLPDEQADTVGRVVGHAGMAEAEVSRGCDLDEQAGAVGRAAGRTGVAEAKVSHGRDLDEQAGGVDAAEAEDRGERHGNGRDGDQQVASRPAWWWRCGGVGDMRWRTGKKRQEC